jgi:hypothetical protein
MFVGPLIGPAVFMGRSATDGRYLEGGYNLIYRKREASAGRGR